MNTSWDELYREVPQDPFLPIEIPTGPAFLDTAACLCTYRETPISDSHDAAWECNGNRTSTRGKWFRPVDNTTFVQDEGPIWDASNPPDAEESLMYDDSQDALVPFDSAAFSVYDAACTAQNQTTFSTAFYRAVKELQNNETMVDAVPCWRGPTAIPMQIMTLDDWQQTGCNEGFLCQNNTVNSLPQYCPPIDACQDGRAAGSVCQFNQNNIGMGPFEPVVCQRGYYCPKGGAEKILCPAGHYCQPGSADPTPCSTGSLCPPGSGSQNFYVPFIILITLDVLLVLTILLLRLRKQATRTVTDQDVAGYKTLHDLSDQESCRTLVPDSSQNQYSTVAGGNGDRTSGSVEGSPTRRKDDHLTPELVALVTSMRKATETAQFGLSFQYTNLSYHPKGASRPILHGVTGTITRGALTAVMGGSGAGKTTFMNVLMGKLTNTGGTVTVNHMPNKIKQYKKLIGYVPQDDIVLPDLTVKENILHSARIRLPRTWSEAEIHAHVDIVIECLQLSHVQNSLIGTTGKPYISGGQRKRVSIGMELAAAPMAIFLDEPTSGLDAAAASSIMRTLKSIASLGISVIVTIHQPRAEIMEMMDELILLANGQVVCKGTENFVQHYFENIGFCFPAYTNSGDVITDIITGNGQIYKTDGNTSTEWLVTHWACSRLNDDNGAVSPTSPTPSLENGQRSSFLPSPLIINPSRRHDPTILDALSKRGASYAKQTWRCFCRAMLQQWRHKSSLCTEIILASLAAFLLGLSQQGKNGVLFHGIYKGTFSILSPAVDMTSAPQLSMLMGVAIGLISAGPGVRVFSEEILLHRREAEAGHSRLAYFLAKVLATVPRMLFACLHFSVLLLFISRLTIPWGIVFAANLAYFWCIYGVASIVSMLAKREDAPLLATMVSLIMGIVCGAAPSLTAVTKWHLLWLWRMSPGVWFTELYFGELVRPYDHLYQTDMAAKVMGFNLYKTARNIGVLLAIGVAYRLVAFVGLLRGKRLRI